MEDMINRVYLGSCLDLMAKIPDGSIDLVVTDPPYGILFVNNHSKEQFEEISNDDFASTKPLLEEYFKECYRILKEDSAIYSFCSWHKVDFFKQEIEKYFTMKNLLLWSKKDGDTPTSKPIHTTGDLAGAYGVSTELIVYAHKGRCLNRGKRYIDLLSFPRENTKLIGHPTPKPPLLLKLLIENSSDKDAIIFDGFAGSGSTGVACAMSGRRFIGAELNDGYHKIATKRINDEFEKMSNPLIQWGD
jgi:site-specific DNA-methyltransferase (adenine-specific)